VNESFTLTSERLFFYLQKTLSIFFFLWYNVSYIFRGVTALTKAEVIESLKKAGLADGQTSLRFAGDGGFAEITIPAKNHDLLPENKHDLLPEKNLDTSRYSVLHSNLAKPDDAETLTPYERILRFIRAGQNDKATFRRVSELSWDYTDDFDEDVYIPSGANTWKMMSVTQLHSYFYHRKQFKNGIFVTKYPTYIYIYISEVLFREGAVAQLAFILANTAHKYPNIKSDICRYIKDYYIVNRIDIPFFDYLQESGADGFFPSYKADLSGNSSDIRSTAGELYSAADADINRSKFLSEYPECKSAFRELFDTVIENVTPLFELYGIDPHELIRSDAGETEYYYPFTGVLYCGDFLRTNEAKLNTAEVYKKRGSWFVRSVVYTPKAVRIFAGYIIKAMENALREKYTYPLLKQDTAEISRDIAGYGGTITADRLAKIVNSRDFSAIIREVCGLTGENTPVPVSEKLKMRMNSPVYSSFRAIMSVDTSADFAPDVSFRDALIFSMQSEMIAELRTEADETSVFRTVTNRNISHFNDFYADEFYDYIYWRTRVRENLNIPLSFSFERIYISEIVNDKALSPLEKINTLAGFIGKCIKTETELKNREKSLVTWLKDCYLCNSPLSKNAELAEHDEKTLPGFLELIEKHRLTAYYPDFFLRSDDPALAADAIIKLSGDSLRRSKFFLPETEKLILTAVFRSYKALTDKLPEAEIDPDALFFERAVSDYRPFDKGILCYPVMLPAHLKIEVSPDEYFISETQNRFTRVAFEPERKLFPLVCSFLTREVEINLRNAVGFKGKVSSLPHFAERFRQKLDVKYKNDHYNTAGEKLWRAAANIICSDGFPDMIEKQCSYLLRTEFPDIVITAKTPKRAAQNITLPPPEPIPIKVEVNFRKLDTIRADAENIAKKLLVEEAEAIPDVIITPPEPVLIKTPQKNGDPYKDFITALDENALKLLKMIASGVSTAECESFLRNNNLMPEVAIEAINELALEFTGDIVLENFDIIDDYKTELEKAL
jgi:hypothetical protein